MHAVLDGQGTMETALAIPRRPLRSIVLKCSELAERSSRLCPTIIPQISITSKLPSFGYGQVFYIAIGIHTSIETEKPAHCFHFSASDSVLKFCTCKCSEMFVHKPAYCGRIYKMHMKHERRARGLLAGGAQRSCQYQLYFFQTLLAAFHLPSDLHWTRKVSFSVGYLFGACSESARSLQVVLDSKMRSRCCGRHLRTSRSCWKTLTAAYRDDQSSYLVSIIKIRELS